MRAQPDSRSSHPGALVTNVQRSRGSMFLATLVWRRTRLEECISNATLSRDEETQQATSLRNWLCNLYESPALDNGDGAPAVGDCGHRGNGAYGAASRYKRCGCGDAGNSVDRQEFHTSGEAPVGGSTSAANS